MRPATGTRGVYFDQIYVNAIFVWTNRSTSREDDEYGRPQATIKEVTKEVTAAKSGRSATERTAMGTARPP